MTGGCEAGAEAAEEGLILDRSAVTPTWMVGPVKAMVAVGLTSMSSVSSLACRVQTTSLAVMAGNSVRASATARHLRPEWPALRWT